MTTRHRVTRLDTANTYAEGIEQLQEVAALTDNLDPLHLFQRQDGSQIYRPLTFAENITVLVESFNTDSSRPMEERLALIEHFTTSSTGITYESNSPRVKIQPISDRLINIAPDFNAPFLPIVYDEAKGVEIDTTDKTKGLYNQPLTEKQVLDNRGWNVAMGDTTDGKKTLTEFKDIVFAALSERRNILRENLTAMGFYAFQKPEDQYRALCVDYLGCGSGAGGGSVLNDDASFLLLAQVIAEGAAKKIASF